MKSSLPPQNISYLQEFATKLEALAEKMNKISVEPAQEKAQERNVVLIQNYALAIHQHLKGAGLPKLYDNLVGLAENHGRNFAASLTEQAICHHLRSHGAKYYASQLMAHDIVGAMNEAKAETYGRGR